MKNSKRKVNLFYISAVLYWLAAIFMFLGDKNFSLGAYLSVKVNAAWLKSLSTSPYPLIKGNEWVPSWFSYLNAMSNEKPFARSIL